VFPSILDPFPLQWKSASKYHEYVELFSQKDPETNQSPREEMEVFIQDLFYDVTLTMVTSVKKMHPAAVELLTVLGGTLMMFCSCNRQLLNNH
jgi:hypothetical protein